MRPFFMPKKFKSRIFVKKSMKNKLFIFAFTSFIIGACATNSALDLGGNKVKLAKSYGPVKVDPTKAISSAEMWKKFEANKFNTTEVTVYSPLQSVCLKAGCWVTIDNGNNTSIMVRFKDHFTIPPATPSGTNAFMHGIMFMDTVSVEMLQHFAEDAGKSKEEIQKITAPKFEMNFRADAITLVK